MSSKPLTLLKINLAVGLEWLISYWNGHLIRKTFPKHQRALRYETVYVLEMNLVLKGRKIKIHVQNTLIDL